MKNISTNSKAKELNELLPSNILNEMEINKESSLNLNEIYKQVEEISSNLKNENNMNEINLNYNNVNCLNQLNGNCQNLELNPVMQSIINSNKNSMINSNNFIINEPCYANNLSMNNDNIMNNLFFNQNSNNNINFLQNSNMLNLLKNNLPNNNTNFNYNNINNFNYNTNTDSKGNNNITYFNKNININFNNFNYNNFVYNIQDCNMNHSINYPNELPISNFHNKNYNTFYQNNNSNRNSFQINPNNCNLNNINNLLNNQKNSFLNYEQFSKNFFEYVNNLNKNNTPNANNYSNTIIFNTNNKCNNNSNYNNNSINFKNPNNNNYNNKSSKNQNSNNNSKKHNNTFKYDINIVEYEIEEFENYLKNLQGSPTEFICSQKGAREMQKMLVKFPEQCRTILIKSISTSLFKVMKDIYGNYFIQNLIKICHSNQLLLMLQYIKDEFVDIAKDFSGTHVLQSLLDRLSTNEQEMIVLSSIKDKELMMAYDNNATHVLQKVVSVIDESRRIELNQVIMSNLKNLALDPNGICLVKKYINTNILRNFKLQIIKILTENCLEISQSPYGNYAIQYLLEEWGISDCGKMVEIIVSNICSLSCQKFSSNVAEKIIELIDNDTRFKIANELFYSNKLITIIKNKYGRYVLQKVIKNINDSQRQQIINSLNKLCISSNKEKNRIKSFLFNFEK